MILLSASLMHKNPQRHKIIHGMRFCRMQRSIDLSGDVVEYLVCVISVGVLVADV